MEAERATVPATRDGFIDALRALALVRVLIWHATGDPRATWVVTTMPMMFFVAGSLLIGSLSRRPATQVLRRRLKRVLLPFWFFGALVLSVVAIVDLRRPDEFASMRLGQLWAWILPLVNPTSSAWEAGWASNPLWYLRAYLWILLLSPLLVWSWRKAPASALSALVAIMIAAQVVASSTAAGPAAVVWIFGDLGIFGFFTLLGFALHDGLLDRLTRRDLAEWLGIALIVTAISWRLTGTSDGVVNSSYVALLPLGVAWLCVALLARPWLGRVHDLPIIGALLYWMTRRALSIYLWHSPAIVGSYWLMRRIGVEPSSLSIVVVTMAMVVVVCTATGWIEDVAAARPVELVPRRAGTHFTWRPLSSAPPTVRRTELVVGVGLGVTIALLGASWLVQPTAVASRPANDVSFALPPTPSSRPTPTATVTPNGSGRGTWSADDRAGQLVDVVEEWRTTNDVAGVRLAISTPDGDYRIAVGTDATGGELDYDEAIAATSITKTMTAAIALQLVDEGRLSLDDPIPPIAAVPQLAALGPMTVRQLLMHTSGLVPYQDATGYRDDQLLSAEDAVALSAASPLEWEPGTTAGYSNSGFLALGLLIEQVTGRPFQAELSDRIAKPLGLDEMFMYTTPLQGWVGEAAGGVVSTVEDLSTWGTALYVDDDVLSPAMKAEMLTIDAELMTGLGAFPVCPCVGRADGSTSSEWVGHLGGSVSMHYSPSHEIVIVASFTESIWTDTLNEADVYSLLGRIKATITA